MSPLDFSEIDRGCSRAGNGMKVDAEAIGC
jgi:hypothetical protein